MVCTLEFIVCLCSLERGSYLTLDLGGTFLRVVLVELLGQGKFNTRQKKFQVDEGLKVGDATVLFGEALFFQQLTYI